MQRLKATETGWSYFKRHRRHNSHSSAVIYIAYINHYILHQREERSYTAILYPCIDGRKPIH